MYKVIVKGRTYEQRAELKKDGANWDKDAKVWYFLCNEQAKTKILHDWNNKELKVWAYVDESETPAERDLSRVVVWFKCDTITDIECHIDMTDDERDIANDNLTEYGKVYIDLTGHVRHADALTLADVDELRAGDWDKDFHKTKQANVSA